MNIKLFIGGIFFCAGLCIAGSEGPNCPGILNLVGLVIFGIGCYLAAVGGKQLENRKGGYHE